MLARLLAEEIVLIVFLVPIGSYTIYQLIKEFLHWRRFKKMKREVRGDDVYRSLHEMQKEKLQRANQKENQER